MGIRLARVEAAGLGQARLVFTAIRGDAGAVPETQRLWAGLLRRKKAPPRSRRLWNVT